MRQLPRAPRHDLELPGGRRFRIRGVSAEQVVCIPECAECGESWLPTDEDRWRAYFDADDELVFYYPDCAEREFDA